MTPDSPEISFENSDNFTDLAEFSNAKKATLDIVSINKSKLFTKEQCAEILNNAIEELWLPTRIIGDNKLHIARRQKVRGDLTGFPFMNIRTVTKDANDEIYDFNLLGIIDQDFPQLFKYSEKEYYNWHIDLNVMMPSRKITFIVNLSDPSEYTGGEIEFLNIDTATADINEQGACLIFPSYMPYKINPVKTGNNCILVGHVHGALFK
jgi:PKHD-type hydroxylase